MKKSCVYIDGFNLYYGLRTMGWAQYYWLDVEKLARSFIDPSAETLKRVKYFTSLVRGNLGAESRQKTFINALKAHCADLDIYLGHFLAKQRQCYKCGKVYDLYEEKKTDVNIACHLLMDAFVEKYDCIYIVSGDSDLVPAVNMMKKLNSCPKVTIAIPPKRKSVNLCQSADAWFSIGEKKFQLSQMPETVMSKRGAKLTRPARWAAKSSVGG